MSAPALLSNYTAFAHAEDLMREINDRLMDVPVITDEDTYRDLVKLSTRAGKCLKDIDDERDAELVPLRLETGRINHRYKERTAPFKTLLEALTKRLTAFAKAEEDRRKAEAAEKNRLAQEAHVAALVALEKLKEAESDAAAGVVGVDVLAAHNELASAANLATRRSREAQRAQRDVPLRVSSPGERAVSMRNRTEYTVTDAVAALTEMGSNDDIDAEIVKRAKAWAKLNGRLPNGVTTHVNRSL